MGGAGEEKEGTGSLGDWVLAQLCVVALLLGWEGGGIPLFAAPPFPVPQFPLLYTELLITTISLIPSAPASIFRIVANTLSDNLFQPPSPKLCSKGLVGWMPGSQGRLGRLACFSGKWKEASSPVCL